jgi:hypothetical protein
VASVIVMGKLSENSGAPKAKSQARTYHVYMITDASAPVPDKPELNECLSSAQLLNLKLTVM